MSSVIVPTIDSGNPLYCPEITASRYLSRLRQMRNSSRHMDSFAHRLSLSSYGSQNAPSKPSSLEKRFTFNAERRTSVTSLHPHSSARKRKLEDLESNGLNDFHRLPKRTHSDLSQVSSFILSPDPAQPRLLNLLNAAPMQDSSEGFYQELFNKVSFRMPWDASHYSPRRIALLEHELYGHPIGDETPASLSYLLEQLNRELPGVFLSHQLSDLNQVSHQTIVDLLGTEGYLAKHILEYFRGSLVEMLDLSASLSDEDGLNHLRPQVVLEVFSLPHSFIRLRALNLNGVRLADFDLTRIHHLLSLDTLGLNDTGIGNEAIGHLTSLKYQLKELHIENNPLIDDDCIPSICLFSSLITLRAYGTGIKMPGLRRLASSVCKAGRELDIEIPKECDTYLNNLHNQYQLHPVAPLITNPHTCRSLSTNALKANLAAHAVFNPSIYLSGSKVELIDRLEGILERRLADYIVKEVVTGYASSGEGSGEGDEMGIAEED